MRTIVFLSSLALSAAMAVPALAQSSPPPRPTPNPEMRQQFEQSRKTMEQIHQQARSQMLDALTPAHRQLLASIAGQLATSTTPDYKAAAARLDSALSASEKQAITNAAKDAHAKARAEMERMRSEMPPGGPGGPGGMRSGGMMMGPGPGKSPRPLPSAGEILLDVTMSGPGMEMHMHDGMRMHP
jgi:hypothetical protein